MEGRRRILSVCRKLNWSVSRAVDTQSMGLSSCELVLFGFLGGF
jgi:hypothetical protein